MRTVLFAVIGLWTAQSWAIHFYDYEACQFSKPVLVKIHSTYPGFKDKISHLSPDKTYEVTLRGNTPASKETPYVLIKNEMGKVEKIRSNWLERPSYLKVMSEKCEATPDANRAFTDQMDILDEEWAMKGADIFINDCAPEGKIAGTYKVCIPLLIVDYDKSPSSFSTVKCMFGKSSAPVEQKAKALSGLPKGMELVHVRKSNGEFYDPRGLVEEKSFSEEAKKIATLEKTPFACRVLEINKLIRNSSATGSGEGKGINE